MQHTDKYKLNLIEKDDVFSPDALNDNARSTESTTYLGEIAAKAEIAARQALEGRVAALEVQKIFFGTVTYETPRQTVNLGFTPKAVLFLGRDLGNTPALTVGEKFTQYRNDPVLEIVENGFIVRTVNVAFFASSEHNFIAFA